MKIKSIMLAVMLAGLTVLWAKPVHALAPFVQYQDTEDAEAGYGFGVKHTFLGLIPVVGIDVRASWLHFSDGKLPADFELYPLEVAGTMKLGLFYGGLGLGYYLTSGDFKPDNSVGGFALAGIGFGLGKLGAFAELRYLMLEPGAADLSGIGAQVGVTLPL